MELTKRTLLAATAAFAMAGAGPAVAQDWPSGPVTIIVPWSSGGGTDATARMIGTLLEDEIGVPVAVVNRTGGSGVIGHTAIADAEPDGQTIGVATLEIGSMHTLGLTDLTHEAYAPIGLYNSDPAALFVRTDSDYDDANALLAALEDAEDRAFKASGSAQGGVNHLAMAGMLLAAGMPPDRVAWVPSEGAAPGLQDLAAGGVEIATASLPEAAALIDAGLIRPLAVFASERLDSAPDVPTFVEATGHDFALGSWRGIVAPAGIPEDVQAQLIEAVGAVVQKPEYLSFMNDRGYATQWTPGDAFESFMEKSDAALAESLAAVGLAK
ncbi:tripartite tricarboxylate transporter substrate binding protein [Psychromarinibacter sp. C21-152]|uniref:Tripartite tricarboxylate transporter substrate binding protein n=1 Tax=Psychromarinibacter sediminicola TaxID=3033385 RepID=A0AAE3NR40_9RHOB|nr:tripartite tricarboxylate transporter substrate binding protein [Psychromarinibacter sediminicola]MDF0599415.1 tripartite tricarboxylate transporter substrate binding protein [Psychromarinibacter sediminicola]